MIINKLNHMRIRLFLPINSILKIFLIKHTIRNISIDIVSKCNVLINEVYFHHRSRLSQIEERRNERLIIISRK